MRSQNGGRSVLEGVSLLALFVMFGAHFVSATELQSSPIKYLSYSAIVDRMHLLAERAPLYVDLWNAQDRYGVPSPGACRITDASGDSTQETPCKHWFITLTNKSNANACVSKHSSTDCMKKRPQVFLSGNLHGDEVVGPMAILTLLEDIVYSKLYKTNDWVDLMLDTRMIVAIPVTNPLGYDRGERSENGIDPNRDFPYDQQPDKCMQTATARAVNEVWREHLFMAGITFHGGMQAIAYEWGSSNHRQNTESPDDSAQQLLGHSMRRAAGVFQNNAYPVDRMNRLVYPVRGGMEDWAYAGSWDTGAITRCEPTTFGGYPSQKTEYNDAVLRAFNVLVETSDDKVPAENTLGSHPDMTQVTQDSQFSLADVYQASGPGDGHVPRNARLAASVIDLVSPYIVTTAEQVDTLVVSSTSTRMLDRNDARFRRSHSLDAASLQPEEAAVSNARFRGLTDELPYVGPAACLNKQQCSAQEASYTKWVTLSYDATGVTVTGTKHDASDVFVAVDLSWDVGGALHVNATSALVGTWDPRVPTAALVDEQIASTPQDLRSYGLSEDEASRFAVYLRKWRDVAAGRILPSSVTSEFYIRHTSPKSGSSAWAAETSKNVMKDQFEPTFQECFRVPIPTTATSGYTTDCAGSSSPPGTTQAIEGTMAYVVLPYAVTDTAWTAQSTPEPALPPQSHIVNARHNPNWHYSNNGFEIQGVSHVVGKPLFFGVSTVSTAAPANDAVLCEVASIEDRPLYVVKGSFDSGTVMVGGVAVSGKSVVVYAALVTGLLLGGLVLFIVIRSRANRQHTHSRIPDAEAESTNLNVADV